jgi:probable rRNA maturation factor
MKYVVHQHTELDYENLSHQLTNIAQATLSWIESPPGEMTLALVGTEKIQALNAQFRDLNQPTDVLSFLDGSVDPDSGSTYFGNVIIAVPIAQKQADASGQSLHAELSLLTVHGVLHLRGYDHDKKEDEQMMWELQTAILDQHGLHVNPNE